LFVADSTNSRVRKVTPAGIITTIAGNGDQGTGTGDGGPATSARMNYPGSVAVSADGSVYIADCNNRIRKVGTDGIISTLPSTSWQLCILSYYYYELTVGGLAFDSQGNLFLTDFGIAKLLENASPRLTQTDAIMGTPAYISPEQAQARTVDQRSDIYSLGIILYEMVTGQVPFEAETPLAIILKHVSDPLPPPSLIKKDISPTLEQVILKALAKDPEDRFETAAEFLAAWKRALNEEHGKQTTHRVPEPVSSPTPAPRTPFADARLGTPSTVTSPQTGRSTGWIVGCLIVACLVLTLGGGGIFLASNWGTFNPATATSFPTSTNVPLSTETPIPMDFGSVLLEDDFSTENWGTLADSDTSIEYLNDALNMSVFTNNWFVWSTPNDVDYDNVHMEVTVIINASDPNTAFGIMCNQQASSDDKYYYFAITPSAQYAIGKADVNQTGSILTNNDEWGTSGLITQDASSYRLGADCGNGTLTLYVDGQKIDSVSDSSYTRGGVALFTWSALEATATDISFDDFSMTSLP